jgi:hypothetical protein
MRQPDDQPGETTNAGTGQILRWGDAKRRTRSKRNTFRTTP